MCIVYVNNPHIELVWQVGLYSILWYYVVPIYLSLLSTNDIKFDFLVSLKKNIVYISINHDSPLESVHYISKLVCKYSCLFLDMVRENYILMLISFIFSAISFVPYQTYTDLLLACINMWVFQSLVYFPWQNETTRCMLETLDSVIAGYISHISLYASCTSSWRSSQSILSSAW